MDQITTEPLSNHQVDWGWWVQTTFASLFHLFPSSLSTNFSYRHYQWRHQFSVSITESSLWSCSGMFSYIHTYERIYPFSIRKLCTVQRIKKVKFKGTLMQIYKINLYVSVHTKMTHWKFRILNPKKSRVICPWSLQIVYKVGSFLTYSIAFIYL